MKNNSLLDFLSNPAYMSNTTQEERAILEDYLDSASKNRLMFYSPYDKQREFHRHGVDKRERLLRAGNQLGKSYAGAAEAAFHATGRYPADWQGRRFDRATVGWCGGVTGEVTRDTCQRLLIGAVGARGTGMIPDDAIIDVSAARGVADLADTILVRHVSGENSRIRLKYYEQGREKWQAETLDWLWFDEEPPQDIYLEGLTRTNATGGMVWITFTPMLGCTEVVRRFLMENSPDRSDTNMTIEDAKHIPEKERAKIIASYPAHEREARIKGIPILGSGRIFPVSEESIACAAFDPQRIPDHWSVIGGIDFGWDHPTAAVKLLYNPDGDIIYVTDCYKCKQATPIIHAAALRPWGKTLKISWPHDGLQHDKGSGVQLAQLYRNEGLNMLPEHAQFPDEKGNGVEAGIAEMLMRMETGRFKVYGHLHEWFEEFRLYHRKDGKIVKEYDDLICATRYALMSIRYADYVHQAQDRGDGQSRHTSHYEPLSLDYLFGRKKPHDFESGMSQHQSEWKPDWSR